MEAFLKIIHRRPLASRRAEPGVVYGLFKNTQSHYKGKEWVCQMFYWTNDPVRDAESVQEVSGSVFSHCGMCGDGIYREDSLNYGTPYYDMPDMPVCEHCIDAYLMEKRRNAPCL